MNNESIAVEQWEDASPTYERVYNKLNEERRPISLDDFHLFKKDIVNLWHELEVFKRERLAPKYQNKSEYEDTVYHRILGMNSESIEFWNTAPLDTKEGDFAEFVKIYKEKLAA